MIPELAFPSPSISGSLEHLPVIHVPPHIPVVSFFSRIFQSCILRDDISSIPARAKHMSSHGLRGLIQMLDDCAVKDLKFSFDLFLKINPHEYFFCWFFW